MATETQIVDDDMFMANNGAFLEEDRTIMPSDDQEIIWGEIVLMKSFINKKHPSSLQPGNGSSQSTKPHLIPPFTFSFKEIIKITTNSSSEEENNKNGNHSSSSSSSGTAVAVVIKGLAPPAFNDRVDSAYSSTSTDSYTGGSHLMKSYSENSNESKGSISSPSSPHGSQQRVYTIGRTETSDICIQVCCYYCYSLLIYCELSLEIKKMIIGSLCEWCACQDI